MSNKPIRVLLVETFNRAYRVPLLMRLSEHPDIDLTLVHGTSLLGLCLAQIYRHPMVYLENWNQMLPAWLYVLVLSMISLDIAWNTPVFYFPAAATSEDSLQS